MAVQEFRHRRLMDAFYEAFPSSGPLEEVEFHPLRNVRETSLQAIVGQSNLRASSTAFAGFRRQKRRPDSAVRVSTRRSIHKSSIVQEIGHYVRQNNGKVYAENRALWQRLPWCSAGPSIKALHLFFEALQTTGHSTCRNSFDIASSAVFIEQVCKEILLLRRQGIQHREEIRLIT
jgi:hypothetical protein